MQTRPELILQFLTALAATDEAHRLFREHDEMLAASTLYLRACRLADEYLRNC